MGLHGFRLYSDGASRRGERRQTVTRRQRDHVRLGRRPQYGLRRVSLVSHKRHKKDEPQKGTKGTERILNQFQKAQAEFLNQFRKGQKAFLNQFLCFCAFLWLKSFEANEVSDGLFSIRGSREEIRGG